MSNETVKSLKSYMSRHGLSQDCVADYLGTNKHTVSRWVNGWNKPSQAYENLIKALIKQQ